MKKFEEELKIIPVMGREPIRNQALYSKCDIVELSNGWVSPEDHQKVAKALVNTTDKLDCAEERVGLLEKTVDQLKSQLEKQQPEIPEVPQFVAELIKERKGNWSLFGAFRNISGNKYDNEKLYEWVFAHAGRQEIFAQAWLNGYTVKEKRFYLKNKLTGQRLIRLLEENGGGFLECVTSTDKERMQFTQSEIDSMETGSYEQLEVEE